MQGAFACKSLLSFFLSFPPCLSPSVTGVQSFQAWNAALALAVSQGCWERLFPAEPLQICQCWGLWEGGGLIQQTFPQYQMTRLKITPWPAGSHSHRAAQPQHSVQDGLEHPGGPELTQAGLTHHSIRATARGGARGRRGKGHEDESVALAAHLSLFGRAPR